MNRQKVELSPLLLQNAGRTVYNAGYKAGKTVVNAAIKAVNDSVTKFKKNMKDREDAARAAKKERELTKRAFTNMTTPLQNKYIKTPEERSYEAEQRMADLQKRVYERERNRNRRA